MESTSASPATFQEVFCTDAKLFAQQMQKNLATLGLQHVYSEVDHICYRAPSIERYEQLKAEVSKFSELIAEAYIHGRPIATFRLSEPISLAHGKKLSVFEIPAPKAGIEVDEGFEHIEVLHTLPLAEILKKFPQCKFDTSLLHTKLNPEISLQFENSTVKFHGTSLEQIVVQEQNRLKSAPHRTLALLDLDDTLFDSAKFFVGAAHLAVQEYTQTKIEIKEIALKMRSTLPDFFKELGIMDTTERENLLKILLECWKKCAKKCVPAVGVPSMLSCLFFEGFDIHIWTARDLESTKDLLLQSGLDIFITDIHAYHLNIPGKPIPEAPLKFLVKASTRAFLLGDSNSDREGAQNLQIPFLQAAWVTKHELSIPSTMICETPFDVLRFAMEFKKEGALS